MAQKYIRKAPPIFSTSKLFLARHDHSLFLFVQDLLLFPPFVCAGRRSSVRTAFKHGCWEQMSKHESWQRSENMRKHMPPKFGTRATTTSKAGHIHNTRNILDVVDTLFDGVHTDGFFPAPSPRFESEHRHPPLLLLVSVHSFDHNSTPTSTVCLFTAIPEAAHRLPVFCIVSFPNNDLPLPFCTQIRQVVGLLMVFPKKKCASHNRRSG